MFEQVNRKCPSRNTILQLFTVFSVVLHHFFVGGLSVSVEGPSKAQLTCVDNSDGTCSASYLPTEVGEYKVNVKFAEEHIPGSPFTAKITPGGIYNHVRMFS